MAGSQPKLHTMVHRRPRIQGVLEIKVKVEGHVIRTLVISRKSLLLTGKWIATKLAHDGPKYRPHRGCAEGQGQSQRSRDTALL